ncbi:Translation initiation factor IF2_ mitochondriallike [Caligus rogercresseyi]|uniref:Translation initiation factor IF-2, mitochondrial n=1 Tax=Caligus rogercresseyi TaxID=217165 RepID=A0A7T8QWQ0_CALRO|nr:Translation initiation factor IF2_ mitochondriallike [Caligus rogercresseyi]
MHDPGISGGQPLMMGGIRPRKTHKNYDKYIMKRKSNNQEIKKKFVTLWHKMNINQLAQVLEISSHDLFDLVLDIPGSDFIQDEETPIGDSEIFVQLGKKLHFKAKFVASPNDPSGDSSSTNSNRLDLIPQPENPQHYKPRSPIVSILGHIDHGKTTLLDYLRKSSVTQSEFGGITQHIGAFSVPVPSFVGNRITFIDTPGHSAFKSMRNRGVCATDIAILVVDASEGVLEQTLESLRMIKDSGRPYIVAINKIDRPNADVSATKKELMEAGGVHLEEFGGDVMSIPISALKGTNINELLNSIGALSEVLELKGDPSGQIKGLVLEANVEAGVGRSTVFLVQKGTLKKGDVLVAGTHYAKVRTIKDEAGNSLMSVGPSGVVRISGWKSLPSAGDEVLQSPSEKKAVEVIKHREQIKMAEKALTDNILIEKKRSIEREIYKTNRSETLKSGRIKSSRNYLKSMYTPSTGVPKLSLIIKADVHGSLEALLECLQTYDSHEEVKMDIVDFGVGEISERIIYAFNVPVSKSITSVHLLDRIRSVNVIYKLIDDVKEEINARMPLVEAESENGVALLQKEFLVTLDKKKVLSGNVLKSSLVRVKRGKSVLGEGLRLRSLKHLKEEVKEMSIGMECGLILEDNDIQFLPSDKLEFYSIVQKRIKRIGTGDCNN